MIRNNKGYMLVEIILASAIAFGIAYFIINLTIKLKNKNDDLLVETLINTDKTIVINKLMEEIVEDPKNFNCNLLSIDKDTNTIKYDGKTINIISDYGTLGDTINCNNNTNEIIIDIPLSVKQLPNNDFNITIDYKYKFAKITYETLSKSYRCANVVVGNEPFLLDYTGNCEIIDDGGDDWRIKFLTSGTLKVNFSNDVDIFLVGGGGNGGNGGGGGGGYTQTYKNIKLSITKYSVVIGEATKASSFVGNGLSYTANPGNNGSEAGGSGGSGGGGKAVMVAGNVFGGGGGSFGNSGGEGYGCTYPGCYGSPGGSGQNRTTCEFGEGNLKSCNSGVTVYSGGGGGSNYAYNSTFGYWSGTGGSGGGGNAGQNGKPNTGGGGGSAAKGGSGIVIIRNKR